MCPNEGSDAQLGTTQVSFTLCWFAPVPCSLLYHFLGLKCSSIIRCEFLSFIHSLCLRQWLWRQVGCRCGAELGIVDGGRY